MGNSLLGEKDIERLKIYYNGYSRITLYRENEYDNIDLITYIRTNYDILEEDYGWSTKTQQWICFKIKEND